MNTAKLTRIVSRFIAHKRALGRIYRDEEEVLLRLCHFVSRDRRDDMDTTVFGRWMTSIEGLHPNTRHAYCLLIRKFCLYRRRLEPDCFVPPADLTKPKPHVTPTILEPADVARMLDVASSIGAGKNSLLLGPTLRIALILFYTAGLRRRELLRLVIDDVSQNGRLLRIRESKFFKSRWVPLSTSSARELRHFLELRSAVYPAGPSMPLLCNHSRASWANPHAYSNPGIRVAMLRLFKGANVRGLDGRYPRIHDLRHSFAVQSLLRWYRTGADVQANLPKLALFMGHVSISSTAYYLRWTPAIREVASSRFEAAFGTLMTGGVK